MHESDGDRDRPRVNIATGVAAKPSSTEHRHAMMAATPDVLLAALVYSLRISSLLHPLCRRVGSIGDIYPVWVGAKCPCAYTLVDYCPAILRRLV